MSRYVDYLCQYASLKEEEALFMVSVYAHLIESIGYYFEIPDIENFLRQAYQEQNFSHLYVLARTYFLGFGVTQDKKLVKLMQIINLINPSIRNK